ncbi:MAG: anaphase promoting complex subunit 5 [Caeruleum heppii]|nr:MAG: anaphase promoting complex subunit 5 [Caeruleum heppii]
MLRVSVQVLETEDAFLSGQTYSFVVDAQMGLAGQAKAGSPRRNECMTQALESIDRAFAEYSRIDEVRGQCEMMAKKATIMQLFGDPVLANDYAAKYLAIRKAAQEWRDG